MKERFYKWTTSKKIVASFLFLILVGPITLVDSLLRKDKFTKNITYTKGKIIIG